MAILNYTTSIATEKTAIEIQKKLIFSGAKAFLSEYDDNGIMCALSFKINDLFFRLPINIDGVYEVIQADRDIPKRLKTYEQAARVAWRIIKNWIEAQIAIVQAGQAEIEQVFLPYLRDQGGRTLYETLKKSGYKQVT